MTKFELMLLHKYISDLEYDRAKLSLSESEISLLKEKIYLLGKEKNNYLEIIKISDKTIDSQEEIIYDLQNLVDKEKKKSFRKGAKIGAGVGSLLTILLCLLVA